MSTPYARDQGEPDKVGVLPARVERVVTLEKRVQIALQGFNISMSVCLSAGPELLS